MITKIGTNCHKGQTFAVYLATGNAGRDAEDKPVNGKAHAVFSLPVKENPDGTTMWVNVNGWRSMYASVAAVRKGDSVLVIGQLKKREYNGKDYYDLDADFCAVSGGSVFGGSPAANLSALTDRMDTFAEIGEEDGELPF